MTRSAAASADPAAGPVGADARAPAVVPPVVPKGGGAIRTMGETFTANPATGTATMRFPLPLAPGRAGFGPRLALSYDSGSGNGPFGLGWSLDQPAISRRTDRRIPRYDDATESDTFVLSGSEDLVPLLERDASGRWRHVPVPRDEFLVHRYRPRVEGLFARIERWVRRSDGDTSWRTISRDNVTTWYGRTPQSRIADPADPTRVFSWLICSTYDDKGNATRYDYEPETAEGVFEDARGGHTAPAHERNRTDAGRGANRYLTRIRYGNRVPNRDADGAAVDPESLEDWMFEVVFDYGDGHYADAPAVDGLEFASATAGRAPGARLPVRPDPFSTYRAGFEVRTYRLCHRMLMFHRFPEQLGRPDYLTRALRFEYEPDPAATYLRAVVESGYELRATAQQPDRYLVCSFPPVELEYSRVPDAQTLAGLPVREVRGTGLDAVGSAARWVDLDGDGATGILTEHEGAWYYRRNAGALPPPDGGPPVARFESPRPVAARPALATHAETATLIDLTGEGRVGLATLRPGTGGFHERTDGEDWSPFRPFEAFPNLDVQDPHVRMLDLDGDGVAEIALIDQDSVTWYPSLGRSGFGPAMREALGDDPDRGPRLVLSDAVTSFFVADLSGDGTTDLVRISNGAVSYWPNLGYGRFGARVVMDNAPVFSEPELFDPARVHLADVDGSGTTDIVYLGGAGATLYRNLAGNGWSDGVTLPQCPVVEQPEDAQVVDLLGAGTACLVWSGHGGPMRYVDLMGGHKPHLLVGLRNNLGAGTRLSYVSSTAFCQADRMAGRPWTTRLPFAVHVLERVETTDHLTGNRLLTRYAYHDGHFDAGEREFRGFGLVEQWDTQHLAALTAATNVDAASHTPPVLTRTWFHTGTSPDGAALPDGLTIAEQREACRALKGVVLRREVYGLDASAGQDHPYVVTEQEFTVHLVQPRQEQRHAVFYPHQRQAVESQYDRVPADPRVKHTIVLQVDPGSGNVLRELRIAYGRRATPADLAPRDLEVQARPVVLLVESTYTNAIGPAHPDDHRIPAPAAEHTSELTGFHPAGEAGRFTFEEWAADGFAALGDATEIAYNTAPDHISRQRRLVEAARTFYRADDLTTTLPFATVQPRAVLDQVYRLAFTPQLLAAAFVRRLPGRPDEELLPAPGVLLEGVGPDQGGYVPMDGGWWIPGGRGFFDPAADPADPAATAAQELATARAHFHLPRKVVDPFGHATVVTYDAPYDLLVTRSVDAVGNEVAAEHDYRVLLPRLVTDPNGNRTAAAFDALGLVVATALMGKATEQRGDLLGQVDPHPSLPVRRALLADPPARAAALLGTATTRIVYDLDLFRRSGQPAAAVILARETHLSEPGGSNPRIQVKVEFTDGFGRPVQAKRLAEPGDAPRRQTSPGPAPDRDPVPGSLVRDAQGRPVLGHAAPRWVGTGRTVFNNKGLPVRRYEPFFSATHLYEPEPDLTDTGVSPQLFYDPVDRIVAVLHPDHTYEKVVHSPWSRADHDRNDCVAPRGAQTGDPRTDPDVSGHVRGYFEGQGAGWETWLVRRAGGALGADETEAAQRAALHAGTPVTAHLDPLGRPFTTVAVNRVVDDGAEVEQAEITRVGWDVEGNQRTVHDALDRLAMRSDYDMLGRLLHQAGMDTGERWSLPDVTGAPVREWDGRGHMRRVAYDPLRRPTDLFLTDDGGERLAERTVYGEAQGATGNHRTRVFEVFDAVGRVTHLSYDFTGNLTASRRDLLRDYDSAVDWSAGPPVDDGSFTSTGTYDALNRVVTATTPDGSVYRPGWNEAGLLNTVDVAMRGSAAATAFVTDIDYDAKGRRQRIAYANGTETTCTYDPATFRLVRLRTTRPPSADSTAAQLFADPAVVQDLAYTYDPVGNLTRIRDAAQKVVIHDGRRVEPVASFTCDALYRLVEAGGREHIGQTAFDTAPAGDRRDRPFVGVRAGPNDLQALRTYTETYRYDLAGNLERMRHVAAGGGWTRTYAYGEASLLEPARTGNRLSSTAVGGQVLPVETYSYTDARGVDGNGGITAVNGAELRWDDKDRLHRADLGGGGIAWYTYDAGGRRMRKVIESQDGIRRKERIYLGPFEVFREYDATGTNVRLSRESLRVMDDQAQVAVVETLVVDGGAAVDDPAGIRRFQVGDHLGTASLELDEAGALISLEEFTPYGASSFQAGRSAAEVSLKRYRYISRERDDETGFDYAGARFYASWLGRWCSPDPELLVDGPNLYRYCRDNPVRFRDPAGTDPVDAGRPDAEPNPRTFKTFDDYRKAVPKQTDEMARKLWDEAHKKKYLILYDKGDDEFKRQAQQAAKDHGVKAQSVESSKLSDVVAKEKPDVIMTFGHGISNQMSFGDSEWIGAPTLKRELKEAKQSQQIIFVVQACSCGKKNGLADTLQADPDLSNYTFVSHVDVGHVTRNSDVRVAGGNTLPEFLRQKVEYQYSLDKVTARKVVTEVLRVATDAETGAADKINTVIRESAVLGFDALWELVAGSGDVGSHDAVKALNLSADALARLTEGIKELRSRLSTAAAKHAKPPPLKHHVTEIR
ncbi:SpvB/TcaC N-terminal domain-containing protein [Actinoplanes sp. NPDC049316]|uniref:SpvB/TcaC N-terminal domain-containing protein n=1 Tax=Actinoplanes sp. NPDC049316 TaxID=3154727 RepID=UPI00343B9CC2